MKKMKRNCLAVAVCFVQYAGIVAAETGTLAAGVTLPQLDPVIRTNFVR